MLVVGTPGGGSPRRLRRRLASVRARIRAASRELERLTTEPGATPAPGLFGVPATFEEDRSRLVGWLRDLRDEERDILDLKELVG